ncbi:MAG TPA: hypothetical protein DCO79_08830 [Spirochaeta sp.]|nr:hypothetical protein [Spirochaeta sp.]
MKVLNIILLSFFIVFSLAAGGKAEITELSGPSGVIEGGLRILQVDEGPTDLDFTIYRGDYIVFDFEKTGAYDFMVADLEIDTVMPRPATEKSYVKMKESGDYAFTLGERKGVFHVLELENPNYHELSAAEASDLIKNVSPVIIDVRTSGEYNSGHVPEANLLPVQIFADNLSSLEKFKDEDILLYCASGNRSTVASKMLIDAGFTKVYNMRHGMSDWVPSGLPVE